MPKTGELLDKNRIISLLPDGLKDIDLCIFDCTDSTNNVAKKLILEGAAEFTVVAAEQQTAGRGRLGRSFYSPANTGLYMTLLLNPKLATPEEIQLITVMAAVAVRRAIAKIAKTEPQIKWVNDIFIGDKKVCGILAEAVSIGSSIAGIALGIGVNCSTESFPHELECIAASIGSNHISRNALAAEIIQNIAELSADISSPHTLEEYKNNCLTLGKTVLFNRDGSEVSAVAYGINSNGNLMVKEENGNETTLFYGDAVVIK